MAEWREIFLWCCAECGTVVATQRRMEPTVPTHPAYCSVCQKDTAFTPVTINLKTQQFLVRIG